MMNKIVAFLEKHVQWIALGLGGLYLAFMIWSYVLQTPVLVTGIAPTPLTPGEVDQHILDTLAIPLATAMKDPNVPEMAVPNFIDQFKSDMDFSSFKPYEIVRLLPDSQTIQIQLTNGKSLSIPTELPIAALPPIPPAVAGDTSTGKSNVQLLAVVAPNGAPAGAAQPPPAGAAAAAAQPGGDAAVVAAAGTKDISWVTVGYSIPRDQLVKSFAAAHIPAWLGKTTVLQIQLYREETLPAGKWSDPKLITPINYQSLLPLPNPDVLLDQQNYLPWAQQHVIDILQPGFYVVNKGDAWDAPGVAVITQAPVLAPLDPAQTYPSNVLSQYPADQRLAYFRAKYKLKQSQQPQRGTPNGGGQGPPPGMQNGGGAPPDPGAMRPAGGVGSEILADNFPPGGPPSGAPPFGNVRGAAPGGAPNLGAPANPAAPGAAPVGAPGAAPAAPTDPALIYPMVPGEFDPKSLATDITGWAHDDSVVPGHTYRYMIQYRIKNPIWNTNAAKNNPALTKIFDILSPPGTWSKPINVASTTNFFVFANSRPGAPARIIVYKWQDGVERSKKFDVAPGDIIGGKDGDIDFSTGWTVVDLRFDDPRNDGSMTLLVMDPNGIIERRDYRTDQAKPERTTLDGQVSATAGTDQLAGGKTGQ